jgi:hypothetical protein
MLDVSSFDRIKDFEEVEKVVYFHREPQGGGPTISYRVEAVRATDGRYSTRVYRDLDVIVQPSEIRNGVQLDAHQATIWVRDTDAPWTHRDSADDAIKQLLSLIT